jgi:hypothetical protein
MLEKLSSVLKNFPSVLEKLSSVLKNFQSVLKNFQSVLKNFSSVLKMFGRFPPRCRRCRRGRFDLAIQHIFRYLIFLENTE